MQEEEMIVSIVAIACGTGIVLTFLNTIKAAILRRAGLDQTSLVNEVRALREEVQHVRQQNNDVILSLDNQMKTLDRRMDHLEDRSLSAGSQAASEHQVVGSRRG